VSRGVTSTAPSARKRPGRRARTVDVALAIGAFAFSALILFSHGFGERESDVRDADALGVALVALGTLALVVRRSRPLLVFALSAGVMAPLHALNYPGELGLFPALAVYSLARFSGGDPSGRARVPAAVPAAAFGALGIVSLVVNPDPGILAGAVVWAGAWIAGDRARRRRERIAELEERALRAEREAERERRLAAAEERTQIARDLHDSAGHAINVILVQAGAALLLQERDPERSREALETIEAVARETVDEIDQLVRALREDGSAEKTGDEVEPPAGLAALDTLADRARAGGLNLDVQIHGEPRPLAPAVDRASYRILQEALTNASLHGPGTAEVELAFGSGEIEITVANPTVAGEAPGNGGHGLVGMRERTALLGGRFDASASDGVFRVRARLPYGKTEP
jgi:signal transduction histidine kinase